jgi:RimJ/RimL family protein N-acetyltransferase
VLSKAYAGRTLGCRALASQAGKPGCGPAVRAGKNARMLRGEMTGLRARHDSDIPILHAELYDDVATRARADSRPWYPIPPGPGSPYQVSGPDEHLSCFSVVELATGALAGEALLWGIDLHNRTAHVGISLLPASRGRSLGTDVVRVLCHYGFAVRGLHRLQAETLADNHAMIKAATRAGFTREGTLRRSAWVNGNFADEVILGLLAAEWQAS